MIGRWCFDNPNGASGYRTEGGVRVAGPIFSFLDLWLRRLFLTPPRSAPYPACHARLAPERDTASWFRATGVPSNAEPCARRTRREASWSRTLIGRS